MTNVEKNAVTYNSSSEFDSNYWNCLDDTQKFYYEAFLTGDGYIKSSDNTVGIDLAIKDYEWIEKYKNNLNINNKVYIRDQRPGKNSISISIRKKDKHWVRDLKRYGMIPRKTGKETLPVDYITNKKEAAAVLLGIFDSDGSIYKETDTNKYRISFCGNETVCNQINDIITTYTDIESNCISLSNKKCNFIYSSRFGAKNDLIELYNFMYETNPELENAWLDRKHNIFTTFMLQSCRTVV